MSSTDRQKPSRRGASRTRSGQLVRTDGHVQLQDYDGNDPTITVSGTAGKTLRRIVQDLEKESDEVLTDAVSAFEGILELRSITRDVGRDTETFQALVSESARLLTERQPRGSAQTADRVRYLVASGAYSQEQIDRAEKAIATGAIARMERTSRLRDVTESLSTGEVAALLAIDASRVRHRQAADLLYSFLVGKSRRYPSWQFIGGDLKVLPHLPALVRFIRGAGLQHGTVTGVMTNRQDSLVALSPAADAPIDGMTPVEWLVEGNDPQLVFDLFESYLVA
jgi:hypothetical protein